jgi:hypothetical protein
MSAAVVCGVCWTAARGAMLAPLPGLMLSPDSRRRCLDGTRHDAADRRHGALHLIFCSCANWPLFPGVQLDNALSDFMAKRNLRNPAALPSPQARFSVDVLVGVL